MFIVYLWLYYLISRPEEKSGRQARFQGRLPGKLFSLLSIRHRIRALYPNPLGTFIGI
jgi:hypothetical protein